MKKTVFLKSTIRQFGRSLFILLLIGVISFAFVARLGEYLLISQETERLGSTYRSIGTLISSEEKWGVPDEVAEYLEQAPYVAYTDHRQYLSGVLQNGLYNADTGGSMATFFSDPNAEHIFHLEFFFYGIYMGEEYTSAKEAKQGRYEFRVDEVVSGYPEYVAEGKNIALYVDPMDFGDRFFQLKTGQRYLLRTTREPDATNALIPSSLSRYSAFVWLPLASDLDWFLPASSDLDLTRPEYARLSSTIRQSHDNACALDLTATADMTAMPFVNPQSGSLTRYYLMEGRWLDHGDHLAGNRVIVIHEGLAEGRGLKVGDSITLKLRDAAFFDTYSQQIFAPLLGYRFELQDVGHEFPSQTETFEIVGVYRSFKSTAITTMDYQLAYIPLSVFPASFTPAISPEETEIYGVILDHPDHEEAFKKATQSDLEAMGYYITFMENGYQGFKNATNGIRTAAWSNVLIFGGIVIVCYCLAAFVYFRFRQKDLAISRALGVPVGQCVLGSALPLALVGGIGIVAGSALGWVYTLGSAESLLTTLAEAAQAEAAAASLPTATLVFICLALIAALLALALVFAAVTAKKPVLSQLQGRGNRK